MNATPEIEEIAISPEALRKYADARALVENLVDLIRQIAQLPYVPRDFMLRQRLAQLRELQCKQIKRRELSRECLRRRDADFRSGVRIDNRVGLASRLAADDVADREQERPLVARFFHRGQRVGGFTRLADADDKTLAADDRIAVTKLRRIVDFNLHPRERLDEKFADMRRMERGSHRADMQTFGSRKNLGVTQFAIQRDRVAHADAAEQRIAHSPRLLVD